MKLRSSFKWAAAAATLAVAQGASAQVAYVVDASAPIDIPGLTGFATTGADMGGLLVTAVFGAFSQTVAWSATDADSGGVAGTGWGLSLDGDSFNGSWNFTIDPNRGQLTQLVLDGRTALTILDRTEPNTGTAGSAQGADFSFLTGCGSCVATATYASPTGVAGAAPLLDLFQYLSVTFGATGPRVNWSFRQDTDNDSRFVPGIPEPETYAMMLGGLAALGYVAKRRRKRT